MFKKIVEDFMNKKRGFTVVELVIVIAVIAVLSGILIPTFAGLVKRSQEQALQLELRNTYVEYTTDENVDAEVVKSEKDVYVVVVSGTTKTAYAVNDEGKWVEQESVT